MTISFIKCFIRSLFIATKSVKFFRLYMTALILGVFFRAYKYKTGGLTFGRTPFDVYKLIANKMDKGERFCDLGSGDGLGVFFMNHFYHHPSMGVEIVENLYASAEFLNDRFGYEHCYFLQADIIQDIPEADVYYLALTCFDEESLKKVAAKLYALKPKAIFSVSSSLNDYGLGGYNLKVHKITMPWGTTSLYEHELENA